MSDDPERKIIDLKAESTEEGEIRYTRADAHSSESALQSWIIRLAGVALGVALFFLLIFLFVYVILPILLIVFLWMLLRNLFAPRR